MKTGKAWITAIAFLCIAAMSTPVSADEVTSAVRGALIEYRKGDYATAAEKLDYAVQMIRQKKGDKLKACLPSALEGWTADVSSSQTISVLMLGGGITAERQYSKETSLITVKIVADAPMLRGVMMMFTNPLFVTASGGRMEEIKGQKAIVKYTPDQASGEINVVGADRVIITVTGENVTKQDLIDYAEKIDYKKLGKM